MSGDSDKKHSPYRASWWEQFVAVQWRSFLSVIKEPMLIQVRLFQTIVRWEMYYCTSFADLEGISFSSAHRSCPRRHLPGPGLPLAGGRDEHQRRPLPHPDQHDLPELVRRHQRLLRRAPHLPARALQRHVPHRRLLPVQAACRAAHLPPHTHHLRLHLLLDGRVQRGGGQVPRLQPHRHTRRAGRGQLRSVTDLTISRDFPPKKYFFTGYFVSCIAPNLQVALALAPPLIIPVMLFGGFFLNSKWGFEFT